MTERLTRLEADHYRNAEQFQREQCEAVAAVLEQIIDIVGFEAGPPYEYPLFQSVYSVPRLLEHVRSAVGSAVAPLPEQR